MKKKECPSCAMEVDADAEVCPICQYEFTSQPKSYMWIAIVMAIILLMMFLF